MIRPALRMNGQRDMSCILFIIVALSLHFEVDGRLAHCKHRVRSPTKCHDEGTCTILARLTSSANSAIFYCCKDGYESLNNKCVDIDECAARSKPCEHTCVNHPGTYSCECADGYHMVASTCVEITQCANLNCSHSCFDESSGPVCDCRRGFKLENRTKCVAVEMECPAGYHKDFSSKSCLAMGDEPHMVYVSGEKVCSFGLRASSEKMHKLQVVPSAVKSMFLDINTWLGYFAGDSLNVIYLGDSQDAWHYEANLSTAAIDMAVDYINQRIYVLDETSIGLWAVKNEALTPLVRLIEHGGTITALEIDPPSGWLFYSSLGVVFKAQLDGVKFSQIFRFYDHVEEDVKSEVLAIDNTDLNEPYLYYAVNKNIFCFAPSGRQMNWLTSSLQANVLSMDVFENQIYYCMDGIDGVHARSKDGLQSPVTHLGQIRIQAFYISHPNRQVQTDGLTCDKFCDQLCVSTPGKLRTCSCIKDYTLDQDKKSCIHVNATQDINPPDSSSSPLIEETEAPVATASYNGFLLNACLLVSCVCVVQFLLIWWFYPRRKYHQNIGAEFAAHFHESSSTVALDSIKDCSET